MAMLNNQRVNMGPFICLGGELHPTFRLFSNQNHNDGVHAGWVNTHLPSGYVKIAIEHGH